MKLRIGDYEIRSDDHCFILAEIKRYRHGKHRGEEYFGKKTYHATLDQAIQRLLDLDLRASEAQGATELLAALQEARSNLRSALDQLRDTSESKAA